jgi:hypothetical protein
MNWKTFLEGIVVSAVSGALASGGDYLVNPDNLRGVALGRRLGTTAGIGAIVGIVGWLKQSPLKKRASEEELHARLLDRYGTGYTLQLPEGGGEKPPE